MKFKPSGKLLSLWMIHTFLAVVVFAAPIGFLLFITEAALFNAIYGLSILVIAVLVLLWLRVYVKTVEYELGVDGVHIKQGVWWKHWKNIPYHKITNVKVAQGPIARSFGLATISLQTAGAGQSNIPEGQLHGLTNFEKIKNEILNKIKTKKR